ncbi:hypothetical protein BpHYR1_018497 [Brachionus plicatilis]|uniref:Uncharacterized protein n=1 Tax=Brachionus plicatilis TaxID=10195 RepID=A0A3M7Q8L8_BRAPC|nr:hypothetical protein BpHYR1_018497 [Brachionus plicatilis]
MLLEYLLLIFLLIKDESLKNIKEKIDFNTCIQRIGLKNELKKNLRKLECFCVRFKISKFQIKAINMIENSNIMKIFKANNILLLSSNKKEILHKLNKLQLFLQAKFFGIIE